MNALAAYMFDTNIFDRLLDGTVAPQSFAHVAILATGIQADEIRAIKKDPVKRAKLLEIFELTATTPAASFAFGIEGAGFGQAYWNDGNGNYERMLKRLRELDRKSKNPLNQIRDILIAETAIKNNASLVSDDGALRQVVTEFGGRAIDHKQFRCEL
jgi:predicted nucleic acid-binding protein